MTQDVQPLTWQKRTNLEEHQQFFSKINEIIDNLAPTVDEAEQAIAQATQAITNANAAIATANAASAAADAAAQQAQTAANTVAGYNTRLTAVEGEADTNAGNITALQGRMGTAEGNITALQGVQADYVKKVGAAQTVTSQIMVPTTATGIRDTQIANGTRIQNDLDNYQQMARLNNEQTFSGRNIFLRYIQGINLGKIVGSVAGTLVGTRDGYVELATFVLGTNKGVRFMLTGGANNNNYFEGEYVLNRGGGTPKLYCLNKIYSTGNQKPDLYIDDVDGTVHIYGIRLQYTYQVMIAIAYFDYGNIQQYPANELTPSENVGVVVELPATAIHEVNIQRDA